MSLFNMFQRKNPIDDIKLKYKETDNKILDLIKDYENAFKGNEMDLLVKARNNNYSSSSNVTGYQSASAKFYQAMDLKTGEFIYLEKNIKTIGKRNSNTGTLVWIEKNNEKRYVFKEDYIYHIKVKKALQPNDVYSIREDNYFIEEIIEEIKSSEKKVIEDSYFGTCVFEKEYKYNTLKLIDGMNALFKDNVIFNVDFIVNEKNIDRILSSLKKIYEKSDFILDKSYNKILNIILDSAKYTNNIKLDIDYVKNNYIIDSLYVDDEEAIFYGEVVDPNKDNSLIDITGSYIIVNLKDGKIDCNTL